MAREEDLVTWRDQVDDDIGSMRSELRANTDLTRGLDAKVSALRDQMRPVLDAVETMEAGIRTLGRIGRLGERFGRAILFLVALGVVGKMLFGGASWSDAVAAFSRAFGR